MTQKLVVDDISELDWVENAVRRVRAQLDKLPTDAQPDWYHELVRKEKGRARRR